jgi:hypothetical protein
VNGFKIGFGVDGDGRDAQIAAGANYSHRDLTPVGYQYLAKHGFLKVMSDE